MFKFTFRNPLKVNEGDTLGQAFVKGATSNYLKGTLAAGAGLGVLAIVVNKFSKKKNSSKKEGDSTKETEENREKIEAKVVELKQKSEAK
jgi:hypothetical protein